MPSLVATASLPGADPALALGSPLVRGQTALAAATAQHVADPTSIDAPRPAAVASAPAADPLADPVDPRGRLVDVLA